MKKLFICLVSLLVLCGCSNGKLLKKEKATTTTKVTTTIPKYVDNNPIKVGLYQNDKYLVKQYNTERTVRKDIVFSVYYTNQEVLESTNQKKNWKMYYNQYQNIDSYKIGFSFSFINNNNEKIERTILEPHTFLFEPYFYTYLYDDIHEPDGAFYSHIEEGTATSATIFSSIKIFLVEPNKIYSPLNVTIFTYKDSNDFDATGAYRGISKYTAVINWTN